MADADIESQEGRKERSEREKRLMRSIDREWRAAGYYRSQHVAGIQATGDPEVLVRFMTLEGYAYGERTFVSRMARADIYEIQNAMFAAQRATRGLHTTDRLTRLD